VPFYFAYYKVGISVKHIYQPCQTYCTTQFGVRVIFCSGEKVNQNW